MALKGNIDGGVACLRDILLWGHHGDKFFVVDLAVAVDVSFADHLVDFLVGQLLAQVRHHVSKLGGGDVAVSVLVKYSESVR